jgi:hypothetical protein
MRVMIFAKSTPERESQPRGSEGMEEMNAYQEELTAAGVLLASDALEPTASGLRVRWEGGAQSITDGPFTESKELVAGYWIWQVRSIDEAIEWLKRAPFSDGMELEVRPIFEMPEMATAASDA